MEDIQMKKPDFVFSGVNIGDYEFVYDTILDVIKKYKFGKENGDLFHFCPIRVDKGKLDSALLYKWAEYLRDNEVYFIIKNNYPRIGEIKAVLSKEETETVAKIAGDYYLGEVIGEFGGFYATRAKGYDRNSENPIQGMKNCLEAKETYMRQIGARIKMIREHGTPHVISCQAVTLLPYDFEAGIDSAVVELAPRNMEQIMAFARGANRAYKKDFVGAWLAHEFYGGYHQFDPLKAKRFKMEYLAMYLGGIDYVGLESGFRGLHSHLDEYLPEDHPLAKSYLKEAEDFARFCKSDRRPANGPITKVAFVQGNLDGFGWGNSSSLWGQYYDEKWGFSAPEFSYRVLEDVYASCGWHEGRNFGDHDYSTTPGYGQYDVIPATCPLDVMKQYEWVIFCGWNSMTPEIMETLKAYVRGGGNLYITAAHMRDSIDRSEKGKFVDADLEEFLGVKLSDNVTRCNDGYKFVKYSTIDGVMYPGTKTMYCDPAWSAGYTEYVNIEPTTATPVCYVSDSFFPHLQSNFPIVTEHKYGEGNVIFMATSEYPGAPEIFPLYRLMVKEILSASHRTSDLKVIGSDKIRFAMYEDEEKYKLYIVNSDYNMKQFVKVIFRDDERELLLDSVGLEIIEYKK